MTQDTKIEAVGHTAGPWTLDRDVKTAVRSGAKHVAMVNYYNVPSDAVRVAGDEHDANARLIAAAPDLLALALAVAEAADLAGSMGNGPLARMARAAIARAEGRAS